MMVERGEDGACGNQSHIEFPVREPSFDAVTINVSIVSEMANCISLGFLTDPMVFIDDFA